MEKHTNNKLVMLRIVHLLSQWILGMSILLLSSGTLFYINAWILGGLYFVAYIMFGIFLPKEVLNLRSRSKKTSLTYEKILKPLMFISGYTTYIIAGIDNRFSWTHNIPWYMLAIAIFIFILGISILLWSMCVNPFFDQGVKTDENHPIIARGPYQVVRHPGYLGMITYLLVVPIILGSIYAMIPTVINVLLIMIRTNKEDAYLTKHQKGYQAYKKVVVNKLFGQIKR